MTSRDPEDDTSHRGDAGERRIVNPKNRLLVVLIGVLAAIVFIGVGREDEL